MSQYKDAMEDAVDQHLRCVWQKENNQEHPGECFKNDKVVYEKWDIVSLPENEERCFHLMEWLILFAQDHPNWDQDLANWCLEVLDRNPVHIRTKQERWKSTRNNHMIWKLLMQYHEMVLIKLQEKKVNNFSNHFEFAQV